MQPKTSCELRDTTRKAVGSVAATVEQAPQRILARRASSRHRREPDKQADAMGSFMSCCTTPGGRDDVWTRGVYVKQALQSRRSAMTPYGTKTCFASMRESIVQLCSVLEHSHNENGPRSTPIGNVVKLLYETYLCECPGCPRARVVEAQLAAYCATTQGARNDRSESLRLLLLAFSTYDETVDLNHDLVARVDQLLVMNDGDVAMSFSDLIR